MSKELTLYEVRVSTSATIYVSAEDEDNAQDIAEEQGDEALFAAEVEAEVEEVITSLEQVPKHERGDKPYSRDADVTIAQYFSGLDEIGDGPPVVSLADLEAAGQLRLIP